VERRHQFKLKRMEFHDSNKNKASCRNVYMNSVQFECVKAIEGSQRLQSV
jgi:hypothetical protein